MADGSTIHLAAVIAAAGLSRRMGRPKQLLPWGGSTVIAVVARSLSQAGAAPVICVTGHRGQEVAAALARTDAMIVPNPAYRQQDLLSSYQAGVRWLLENADQASTIEGALLSLGDQPHLPASTIARIAAQARRTPDRIVIPSYDMRRGHPMVLPQVLWGELLALAADDALRTLVNRHADRIVYVNTKNDAVLLDMDTPADYERLRGRFEEQIGTDT